MLADRLPLVAPKLISPNQCGFVKGCSIRSCIGITSEAINLLKYCAYGGNIALKVDIRKAFDTLDWNFLLHVLESFGLSSTFKHYIKIILESAKYPS